MPGTTYGDKRIEAIALALWRVRFPDAAIDWADVHPAHRRALNSEAREFLAMHDAANCFPPINPRN